MLPFPVLQQLHLWRLLAARKESRRCRRAPLCGPQVDPFFVPVTEGEREEFGEEGQVRFSRHHFHSQTHDTPCAYVAPGSIPCCYSWAPDTWRVALTKDNPWTKLWRRCPDVSAPFP